jgi:N utilization substance protein A
VLENFGLDVTEADALIMRARVAMGWVEAPPEPEIEDLPEPELSEEEQLFGRADAGPAAEASEDDADEPREA